MACFNDDDDNYDDDDYDDDDDDDEDGDDDDDDHDDSKSMATPRQVPRLQLINLLVVSRDEGV